MEEEVAKKKTEVRHLPKLWQYAHLHGLLLPDERLYRDTRGRKSCKATRTANYGPCFEVVNEESAICFSVSIRCDVVLLAIFVSKYPSVLNDLLVFS